MIIMIILASSLFDEIDGGRERERERNREREKGRLVKVLVRFYMDKGQRVKVMRMVNKRRE